VAKVVATVALIKDVPIEVAATQLAETACEFFRLPSVEELKKGGARRMQDPLMVGDELAIAVSEALLESGVLSAGDSMGAEASARAKGVPRETICGTAAVPLTSVDVSSRGGTSAAAGAGGRAAGSGSGSGSVSRAT